MNGIKLQKGQIFKSNSCGEFEILKEITENIPIRNYNTQKFQIRFIETGTIKNVLWTDIRKGSIQDYNYKTLCNVACLGEGEYNSRDSYYIRWKQMIHRCYSPTDLKYSSYGGKGVKVCSSWLNFQNYAKWLHEYTKKNNIEGIEWNLDKDVLANINHLEIKFYSPDTCIILPYDLNGFLIGDSLTCGVYKKGNKFYSQLFFDGEKFHLGYYTSFIDAKIAYANKKGNIWRQLIEKSSLSNELKNLLLKYDFSWYWKYGELNNN